MNYISEDDSEFDLIGSQSRRKSVFETQHSFKAGLSSYLPIQHFLNLNSQCQESFLNEPERMPEQTTKQMLKMKNRLKAQRFRQKKKCQQETIQNKLKELEQENTLLKQTKTYCGRCRTKIQKISKTISEQVQHFEMQFEPPKIDIQKSFNGKIWVALGIIMLVIGVGINGFNKQPIEISLDSSFVSKVQKQIQSQESSDIKIPFSMMMKPRISKQNSNHNTLLQKQNALVIKGEDSIGYYSEEMIEVKKDFIMRLHGEINDIGNYL